MKPGNDLPKSGQDTRMNQLLAAIGHLPNNIEYTFVRMILDTLPPVLETAIWVNHAPTDEILTAFNEGTYGRVDRLLRQREKTVLHLSENEHDEARVLLDYTRHSLAQLLLAEALAKAKAPGDCWIETRAVDPARRGHPSEPCPISGPGMVIDVWQVGRDRRAHRLFTKGILAGPPPWGDERIPWVDPVVLDKLHLSLLRRYCRPLLRLRVGHEWRTKRARSPWRVVTQRVIPQLYDYLRPFYPIRRYTSGLKAVSSGKYPKALLRSIRDLLVAERPDLVVDLTEERVMAAVQRHLQSALPDRPLGRAMFQLYPKPAIGKRTTRPR
jgi:hypothetical protein